MTTMAAIDRLVHHAIILEMAGPSIREEEAKATRRRNGVSVRPSTSLTGSLEWRTSHVTDGTRDESDLGFAGGTVAGKWPRCRDVLPPRAL
jgi:hypothetical protein